MNLSSNYQKLGLNVDVVKTCVPLRVDRHNAVVFNANKLVLRFGRSSGILYDTTVHLYLKGHKHERP